MAPRKSAVRNDAVAVIDGLFGDAEDWNKALERAAAANDVAEQIYDLRSRHGLTQQELATLAGTAQSVIARLEDANYQGHSMAMLKRIGAAVGERVRVRYERVIGDREVPIVPAKRAGVIAREKLAAKRRPTTTQKGPKRSSARVARSR